MKDVRFEGFDSRPDLLGHLRTLVPDLEHEVGRWSHRVAAVFQLRHPDAEKPLVWLTLTLTFPPSTSTDSAVAAYAEIERPVEFRRWVRLVWGNVLDKLIAQRAEQSEPELVSSPGV